VLRAPPAMRLGKKDSVKSSIPNPKTNQMYGNFYYLSVEASLLAA